MHLKCVLLSVTAAVKNFIYIRHWQSNTVSLVYTCMYMQCIIHLNFVSHLNLVFPLRSCHLFSILDYHRHGMCYYLIIYSSITVLIYSQSMHHFCFLQNTANFYQKCSLKMCYKIYKKNKPIHQTKIW